MQWMAIVNEKWQCSTVRNLLLFSSSLFSPFFLLRIFACESDSLIDVMWHNVRLSLLDFEHGTRTNWSSSTSPSPPLLLLLLRPLSRSASFFYRLRSRARVRLRMWMCAKHSESKMKSHLTNERKKERNIKHILPFYWEHLLGLLWYFAPAYRCACAIVLWS